MFLILFALRKELEKIFEEFAGSKSIYLKHEKSAQQTFSDTKYTQTQILDFYWWRDPYHKTLWKSPRSRYICWCKPRINGVSSICCKFEWAAWTRSRIITFIDGFNCSPATVLWAFFVTILHVFPFASLSEFQENPHSSMKKHNA